MYGSRSGSRAGSRGASRGKPKEKEKSEDQKNLERLTKLLTEYEAENQKQKLELQGYRATDEANKKKILDFQKEVQQLNKKLNTARDNLKFEKASMEGLKTKYHLIEGEVKDLRNDKINLKTEVALLRPRIEELESTTNNDRAKRVQLMHENEVLRKNEIALEQRESDAKLDEANAQKSLYEKLTQFDKLFGVNEVQQRTIDAQSNEMISLSKELNVLQERNMQLNQLLSERENEIGESRKINDILQHEIFRLRKEVIGKATNSDEQTRAMMNKGTSKLANQITAQSSTVSKGTGNLSRRPKLAPVQAKPNLEKWELFSIYTDETKSKLPFFQDALPED